MPPILVLGKVAIRGKHHRSLRLRNRLASAPLPRNALGSRGCSHGYGEIRPAKPWPKGMRQLRDRRSCLSAACRSARWRGRADLTPGSVLRRPAVASTLRSPGEIRARVSQRELDRRALIYWGPLRHQWRPPLRFGPKVPRSPDSSGPPRAVPGLAPRAQMGARGLGGQGGWATLGWR